MKTYGETIQCKGGHLYLPDPEDLGCPPHCSDPRGGRESLSFFFEAGNGSSDMQGSVPRSCRRCQKKIYAYV